MADCGNIEFRVTQILDGCVVLPGGEKITHAQYNAMAGTHYEPGPLRVKFDYRLAPLVSIS